MVKYVPFLKLKQGEIFAVKELRDDIRTQITPFFDFARRENQQDGDFLASLGRDMTSVERNLSDVRELYLDNFDVVDREIGGIDSYQLILAECPLEKTIPVVGIDRSLAHNNAVVTARTDFGLTSDTVALRVLPDDFQDFYAVEDELSELLNNILAYFDRIDLVFDCRVCRELNAVVVGARINEFWERFGEHYPIRKVIVTGSSIPASIAEIVPVNSMSNVVRNELAIHQGVDQSAGFGELFIGDYSVVSPNYSDVDIEPEILLNIMAPKMLYTYDGHHYCIRGGALRTHPREYSQYNDFSEIIVNQPFYRGAAYSFGDQFIADKANGLGARVTPSTVLRPTINSHVTYMWDLP
ncbi:beta family protein [Thalassospira lucentensis]|uniref:beta family protein n=1 Tax=Thalassospira lucentensis TaxID=168935 RepID=UPI0003B3A89B|nr:beta family protein [Thalassospira lucentensis]RCK25860.1 hypothetical protein TH1_13895 [Thalassospira lucentensis MCCC 1A00383 = DSM 14000]